MQHKRPSSVNFHVWVERRLGSGRLNAKVQKVKGCGAVPAMSKTSTVSGTFECLSRGGLDPGKDFFIRL